MSYEAMKGLRECNVFDKHQLRIARDTLRMADSMVAVMGGMTKEEAVQVIMRLTGKKVNLGASSTPSHYATVLP